MYLVVNVFQRVMLKQLSLHFDCSSTCLVNVSLLTNMDCCNSWELLKAVEGETTNVPFSSSRGFERSLKV